MPRFNYNELDYLMFLTFILRNITVHKKLIEII